MQLYRTDSNFPLSGPIFHLLLEWTLSTEDVKAPTARLRL